MGHKIHPIGFRIGIVKECPSRWFASRKDYAAFLHEDLRIRQKIKNVMGKADISRIEFERPSDKKVKITIFAGKPRMLIGRGGQEVQKLKSELVKMTSREIYINVKEVKDIEKDAQLVADSISRQLERRAGFRRAMKRAMERARQLGVEGVKVRVSGRLGGAEIARTEWYHEGRVPLHTLRANIDYGFAEANTTFGIIGVKVWLFKGEVLGDRLQQEEAKEVGAY